MSGPFILDRSSKLKEHRVWEIEETVGRGEDEENPGEFWRHRITDNN